MVEPIYQLEDISQIYGDVEYQAVKNTVTNRAYFADRIPEIGIINFGSISSNQSKIMNLGEQGISLPIMITSAYVFAPQTTGDEIKVFIYQNVEGNSIKVAQQKFGNNEMPKTFPYGGVLFPFNSIEVVPRQTVINCIFYFRPVRVIAQITSNQYGILIRITTFNRR